jgi:nucleoside-triphosphatase
LSSNTARAAHVLLLTGSPGAGKTTVLRRVAQRLPTTRLGGFFTQEIRSDGQRQGFRLIGFDGSERGLAHVGFRDAPHVSRYGVDVAALDGVADDRLAPRPGIGLYLVDEIGKMECLSPHFVAAVRRLLDAGDTVIATVARPGGGFIAEVKSRRNVELWEVTHSNREATPDRILVWLAARPGGAPRRGDGRLTSAGRGRPTAATCPDGHDICGYTFPGDYRQGRGHAHDPQAVSGRAASACADGARHACR